MLKAMLLALPLLPSVALSAHRPQLTVSLENAVKATYLYKLAPFVQWPAGTFASSDAPFEICVVGGNPFDHFLDKAIAGRKLGTHPFAVRWLGDAATADDCQIVFIAEPDADATRAALQVFAGKPVLTVTDTGTSNDVGSVVQFVLDHGHVRFDVDNAAAARNHLVISSKLLNLALSVKGGDGA
ncbi:MAG TPA: YfiR family protein [Rhodanobacteraceae bacterium]